LAIIRFYAIFLFSLPYFKFIHFWSLLELQNGKMHMCFAKLTKYMLI
jgi:hypothetical protein